MIFLKGLLRKLLVLTGNVKWYYETITKSKEHSANCLTFKNFLTALNLFYPGGGQKCPTS